MNAEKLYRYIYNLLPFPSSPFFNPKTKLGTYLVVVYVEVIFIDFYFLIFIARYFNAGKDLRKKMTVINGMLPQEIVRT